MATPDDNLDLPGSDPLDEEALTPAESDPTRESPEATPVVEDVEDAEDTRVDDTDPEEAGTATGESDDPTADPDADGDADPDADSDLAAGDKADVDHDHADGDHEHDHADGDHEHVIIPDDGRDYGELKASGDGESSSGRRDGLIVGGVLLLLVLVLGGFLLANRDGAGAVYTVYGEEIGVDAVQASLEGVVDEALIEQVADIESATPEQRTELSGALSTVIVQDVMTRAADEQGFEVTEADVDTQIEEVIATGFGGDRAAFEGQIVQAGLTEDAVRLQFRTALLAEQLVMDLVDPIDDAAIQQAYDENFSEPTVAHILTETEEEAQAALDRIDAGEDFADVASEVSIDPGSGAQGGQLGPLRAGQFVPEFEEAALALEAGELSDPVETQFGFHVITVGDPLPLEEVREQIEQGLEDQRMNTGFVELAQVLDEEAMITIDPAFGTWGGLAQGIVVPQADLPLDDALPEGETLPEQIPATES